MVNVQGIMTKAAFEQVNPEQNKKLSELLKTVVDTEALDVRRATLS